ncbi:Putative membrane protein [hydrothermal vent metagenome]|uniref:Membrane protein n=1 Tax=hydrothermal vent metagenome TaxID=652676 RepID=A0A3B1BP38_9ZZZZ
MMTDYPLWELFFSALVSSTLLPGGSEALLAYQASNQISHPLALLMAATIGNSLGGMLTWLLGRWLAWRFPARELEQKHHTAMRRLKHWGTPALLFSWLPVVGDPLCLAAGWLRTNWLQSLIFISVGKALRYSTIIWLLEP